MKLIDIPNVLEPNFHDFSLERKIDWLSRIGALVKFTKTEVDVSIMVGDNVVRHVNDIPGGGAHLALHFCIGNFYDDLREHYQRKTSKKSMSRFGSGKFPGTPPTYA